MTAKITLYHVYSPEEYKRAVEVWRRLLDNPYTHAVEDRRHGKYSLDSVEDAHLYSLIIADGEGSDYWSPVEITLASYSDYGGNDFDAANVRALGENFSWVSTRTGGFHGEGAAWIQLGKLPGETTIAEALDQLEELADVLDGLTDYPLIDEETHSQYVGELAEEAWDQYLESDVRSELAELLGCDESDLDDFRFSEDEIRELYYSFEDNEWNCETATSVVNGRHDEAVQAIADHIIREWRKPLIDPNQLALIEV